MECFFQTTSFLLVILSSCCIEVLYMLIPLFTNFVKMLELTVSFHSNLEVISEETPS